MATLHIETTAENKSAWVRAAQASPSADGPGLANWVIEKLNEAASSSIQLGVYCYRYTTDEGGRYPNLEKSSYCDREVMAWLNWDSACLAQCKRELADSRPNGGTQSISWANRTVTIEYRPNRKD